MVTDIPEQMKIPSVNIQVQGGTTGTASDAEGNFEVRVNGFPVTLYFSHVGYHTKEVRLYRPQRQALIVRLEEKVNYLNEFTIRSSPVVNLLEDKPLYIWDYDFAEDGILMLGSVNMNGWDKRIMMLRTEGDTVTSSPARRPMSLYRDCLGYNHMFNDKEVWQVNVDDAGISLHFPTPIGTFEEEMEPVVGRLGNTWFVRQYYMSNQVLIYFTVDAESGTVTEFRRIQDQTGLNILADRDRLESSNGYTEADRRFEDMCFYDEIFAPMVLLGDSIIIFNFVDGKLEILDPEGSQIASLPLAFERDRHWDEKLLVDEESHRVFTVWERHGMTQLWEISISDGSIISKTDIPDLPFVEKIKVRNNSVYFLYKPNQKPYKQLYTMEI